MPGVYEQGGLGPILRQLFQRLRAIETQQQSVTTDNKGRPVKTTGLVPGSNPPLYGDMYWEPTTGARLMFQGYDSGSDTAYTAWYSGGVLTTKVDAAGFHFYDPSGTEEVRVGQLVTSPALYGLGVLNPGSGILQQVGGYDVVAPPDVTNVSNTAWVAFGTPNSLTLQSGPSGDYLLSYWCFIETHTANVAGELGLSVDGGTIGIFGELGSQAGPIFAFVGGTVQVNTATPTPGATHTVEFFYQLSAAGTADFGPSYFVLQPI